jgi:molecular chaperone IbpA
MTRVTLSPLFRRSIGFDRFHDLFEAALGGDERVDTYPPYNITKTGDDAYCITMALAGFSLSDLAVIHHGNELKVSGRISEREEQGVEYLHRGIATRAFEKTFSLADHVKITSKPEYKDGILRIRLIREVPEEAKPRMIPIADGTDTLTVGEPSEKETN